MSFPSESIINVYPVKIYGLPKNILHVKIHSKKNYVNSRVNIAHKFHIFLLNNIEEIATNLQLYCKTLVSQLKPFEVFFLFSCFKLFRSYYKI